MTHTPGRWNYHHHGEILKGGGRDFFTIRSPENICIAEINRIDRATYDNDEANARLISASPELLAVAKGLLEYAEKATGPFGPCLICEAGTIEMHKPDCAIVTARVAVAKTEGVKP